MNIGRLRIRYFKMGLLGGLVELPHRSSANVAMIAIDGLSEPSIKFDLPADQDRLDAVTAFCSYASEVGRIAIRNEFRRCLGFEIITDPARFTAPRSRA